MAEETNPMVEEMKTQIKDYLRERHVRAVFSPSRMHSTWTLKKIFDWTVVRQARVDVIGPEIEAILMKLRIDLRQDLKAFMIPTSLMPLELAQISYNVSVDKEHDWCVMVEFYAWWWWGEKG